MPEDAPIRAISSTAPQSDVPPKSLENYGGEIIMSTNQTGSAVEVTNKSVLGKRARQPGNQLRLNEDDLSPRPQDHVQKMKYVSKEQKEAEEPLP